MKSLANSAGLLAALLFGLAATAYADEDLTALEQQAMQAAVARVAPAVVRIETVGGLERAGEVTFGTGPTTGLVVGADGWIISSAFNFAQKPTSILVSLPDGTRLPARLVATDHNRMLALLKVEPAGSLPVAEIAPLAEVKVGAWAIAVGRTYQGAEASMSVGIVSATRRMNGRALQTDAKVSPANYGGPLVDIRGRVLGVLVPLSPQGGDEVAGVEWYDSGIGFAIPMENVQSILPRLQAGEDLRPGVLGITLKEQGPLAGPVVIEAARPNSPAAKAGLLAGDKVVEIDAAPIARNADIYRQVQPHYAGDKLHFVVEREGQRQEADVELVAELEPYAHPYLGVLASRDVVENPTGVVVRHVLPESPAAAAGIAAGDQITKAGDRDVATREALQAALARLEPGQDVALVVRRGEESLTLKATLATQPEAIPAELPAVAPPAGEAPADLPAVGRQTLKLAEFETEAVLYVPAGYRPSQPLGVVVWFHGPDAIAADDLVAQWKPLCDANNLMLVAPKQTTAGRWSMFDLNFVRAALADLNTKYELDRQRTVAYGFQGGATLAYVLGFRHRDLVGGVIAVDGPLTQRPPDNEPALPFAVLSIAAEESEAGPRIEKGIEALRAAKYPVTVLAQPGQPHPPADDELAEMLRWIDTLDRI